MSDERLYPGDRGRWVHLLLAIACMLMVGWGLAIIGYVNMHLGWWLMVFAWALLMFWCYLYYGVLRSRRSIRRV